MYVLQRECEDLKIENKEKSKQIADLYIQMKVLKTALKKASKDRQRLEEKIEDMSNNMDDKFSDLMTALGDLKGIYNRQRQCEVTATRYASSFRPQLGRKVPLMVPTQKACIEQLNRIKRVVDLYLPF
jgi:chromosome segregation ATPase